MLAARWLFFLGVIVEHSIAATHTLKNSVVSATISDSGSLLTLVPTISNIAHATDGNTGVSLSGEAFAIGVTSSGVSMTLTPESCPGVVISGASRTSVSFLHKCTASNWILQSEYALRTTNATYITKSLTVTTTAHAGSATVINVSNFGGVRVASAANASTVTERVTQLNAFDTQYAVSTFARFPDMNSGVFLSITNPFFTVATLNMVGDNGVELAASYAPSFNMSNNGSVYTVDAGVMGLVPSLGHYKLGPAPNDLLYTGERQTFVNCVEDFLLDTPSRAKTTVKVNVAWDENDYQIDAGTVAGQTEYKRIIDRNADFGVTHIVYEPRNTLHASRFNSTDGWGWEAGLWFGMGEELRENKWNPVTDAIPEDILAMTAYAQTKGIKLMAMIATMTAFMHKTGSGGWAWDHDIFTQGATAAQTYAQWRGWMRILSTLRASFPDMVMDHRQTAHRWGPWYQLAGSYVEPIAGDENPETYGVPIPSLHTDHVAADNTRIINYKYAIGQLQPPARIPGFIFHQTERTADNGTNPCFGSSALCYDSNTRDFDLLGYKYSLLSTIGTAGQNNVLTMIPARDMEEFRLFPQADVEFIKHWLEWTDENLAYLRNTRPINTLGMPALGSVDGTCAVSSNEGYIFLFNPNMAQMSVNITLDESIGLTTTTSKWNVGQLFPNKNAPISVHSYGDVIEWTLEGSNALVVSIFRQSPRGTPESTSNVLTNIQGPVGSTLSLALDSAAALRVNGVECTTVSNFSTKSAQLATVTFGGGSPVQHAMRISDAVVPPGFTGGSWSTHFTIPPALTAQLATRAQAYPVLWSAADRKATWLVPSRLLLNVFLAHPDDTMAVQLTIDGASHDLVPAYNSRGLVRPRCFLGWYFDASNLTTGVAHTLTLTLPQKIPPGEFQGAFWGNVETIYTSEVITCTLQ